MTQAVRPAPVPAPAATALGENLARARRERGVTLPVAAAATTIRQPFLEAIESGTIGEVVAPVYASGYVRAYAAYLGVELAPEPSRPQALATLPAADGPIRRSPFDRLVLTRPILGAAAGAALLLGFAGYAFYEFRSARDILEPVRPTPVAAAPPIASPMPMESAPAPVASAPPSPAPPAAQLRLSLRAAEHVWVTVTVDGRSTGGFMEAGQVQDYSGRSISVAAGKPSLEYSVDGGAFAPMGALNKDFAPARN